MLNGAWRALGTMDGANVSILHGLRWREKHYIFEWLETVIDLCKNLLTNKIEFASWLSIIWLTSSLVMLFFTVGKKERLERLYNRWSTRLVYWLSLTWRLHQSQEQALADMKTATWLDVSCVSAKSWFLLSWPLRSTINDRQNLNKNKKFFE